MTFLFFTKSNQVRGGINGAGKYNSSLYEKIKIGQ
jgi:hypothetical protein